MDVHYPPIASYLMRRGVLIKDCYELVDVPWESSFYKMHNNQRTTVILASIQSFTNLINNSRICAYKQAFL